MAASASIPPTPQPSTPTPLIIVVCESVPTSVSGYAIGFPLSPFAPTNTTRARYSKLIWCTIPVSGGTIAKFLNAPCPHRKNA